jgi:hypothetical protein
MSSEFARLTITEALSVLTSQNGPLLVLCPKQLNEAQAQAFGRHKGTLHLRGVEHLSASVASHLAAHEGPLSLNDVRTLSVPTAEALSRHKGKLSLLEISQVSDEVAMMLAKHKGPVAIFPLAEMSEKARSILKQHRQQACKEEGLPPRSEFTKLAGTFHPSSAGEYNEWAFVYYPRFQRPDPVLMRVCWRSDWVKATDKQPPSQLPGWCISLLPRIGECIERIYTEPQFGDSPAAYLLDVLVEIVDDGMHAITIKSVDAEGVYWEACVDIDEFPSAFSVSCWGGDHYQSADYLGDLPLNHSIFDSTLEGLKWWQKNTVERAKDIRSQTASLHALSDQERIDRIKDRLAAIAADRTSKTFDLEIVPLTDDELKALPQALPKSHYELLRQVGAFSLGHNDCLVIETFIPRPWEESDYCTPIREEDRMPNEHNYLYMARDIEGECYGYDITKEPFQIVSWDFAICRPEQRGYRSFLDLIEQHVFQEFLRPSSN